ncbi:sigma-70 family RNA polymerase sigma factor [Alkalithermobacter paradoxus]|uniref:RNA polymerase sigma factor n=1 Tax=Alkalithermobacter paradoxus TaxID=29349 RepID=A0A1V4IBW0_9FIRM|nr:RNA polymerase sigma-D factor [[Clostridium] thermoalcaliphilum]
MSQMELWNKYKEAKDEILKSDIKKDLILQYLSLVKIIAGRLYNYYGSNVEYDDLVSYGIIGLIDAIQKYDCSKNIKFETYASVRIRGAIIDEIRNLDWIPRSVRQKSKLLKDAYSKLEMTLGRTPNVSEISKEINKTEDEVLKLLEDTNVYNVISLEEQINDNLKIQIKDDSINSNPEESLLEKDTIDNLKKAIKGLTEREQLIINLYYYEGLTYKEIANILNISESRISQIHSRSILKLGVKMDKM